MKVQTPALAVDIIIRLVGADALERVVLIERKNPPFGWAIPGGFVDIGETVEAAAIREALEETSLHVELEGLLDVYSEPKRDPRGHTVSLVYVARGSGKPGARDDAADIGLFLEEDLPSPLAFDHASILADFFTSDKFQYQAE